MKCIQLIFSPTGGTKKAAGIMTAEWSAEVETIDLSDPFDDFSAYSFQPDDLVLIALPSFAGRVPALAAERLAKISGNDACCVLLCVYGNRDYDDTLVEMEDLAKQCGFTVGAAVAAIAEHSIMHQYATGRPDASDVQQLKSYAKEILEKYKAGTWKEQPKIPGNRPYKKAGGPGLVPKATKACDNCGVCAKQCPSQAIAPENVGDVDSKKCISCMRCVAVCPRSARKVNSALVSAAALALKKACSVRKENELFI